jgi:hypothetical protein
MNTSKLSLVPLCQASLCMDCDMITAADTHCIACGSAALLNLAKALNGEEYTDLVQPQLVAPANFPGQRVRRVRILHHSDAGMNCSPTGALVDFPKLHTLNTDARYPHLNNWWGSFREVAKIVQRAMTVAVFALLVLAPTAKVQSQMQGNPQPGVDSAASGLAATHSILSATPSQSSPGH